MPNSPMVANNCSLVRLLHNQAGRAIEYAEHALRLDSSNVNCLINLANCHHNLKNLAMAETLLQRALLIEPTNWQANYNLALINRKLGRHYNDLKPTTKSSLIGGGQDGRSSSASLPANCLNRKAILPMFQLALIYQQSQGKRAQCISVLKDLMNSSKQAPEVHLLASKLLMESDGSSSSGGGNGAAKDLLAILQQANREHPYYLPVLERLIAIMIEEFNYTAAKLLLADCIRCKPGQVKWYQMLAECHRRAADYDKAIATYKLAITAFPQDTSCLKALLKLSDELGLAGEKKSCESKLEKINKLRANLQEATNDY